MSLLTCSKCGASGNYRPDAKNHEGLLILTLFQERGEQCRACYQRTLSRASDPTTSRKGAQDVVVRSGSQRHALLVAYGDGSRLTADEAMRKAGISDRSCYWKRISELVDAGLLQDTGIERLGEQGSMQRVNAITQKGALAL